MTAGAPDLLDALAREPALAAKLRAAAQGECVAFEHVEDGAHSAAANGIDQHAAATLVAGTRTEAIAAQARRYGKALGLHPAWAERAVAAVGHYGEVFERNLGSGSLIGLPRGPNRPWNEGGMLYAPPLH